MMNMNEHFDRQIPEYYDTMYMDGYTPEEILHALRKKMNRENQEHEAAKKAEAEMNEIPEVKITSVVKTK